MAKITGTTEPVILAIVILTASCLSFPMFDRYDRSH